MCPIQTLSHSPLRPGVNCHPKVRCVSAASTACGAGWGIVTHIGVRVRVLPHGPLAPPLLALPNARQGVCRALHPPRIPIAPAPVPVPVHASDRFRAEPDPFCKFGLDAYVHNDPSRKGCPTTTTHPPTEPFPGVFFPPLI